MTSNQKIKPSKKSMGRKSWKKPKDKPKRPLSAYNFFFRHQRNLLVSDALRDTGTILSPQEIEESLKSGRDRPHRKTHGKVSFKELTSVVSNRWKSLSLLEKATFEARAKQDTLRYHAELETWNQSCNKRRNQGKSLPTPSKMVSATPQTLKEVSEQEESGYHSASSLEVSLEPSPFRATSSQDFDKKSFQDEVRQVEKANSLSAGHLMSLLSGLDELASKLEPECHEIINALRSG